MSITNNFNALLQDYLNKVPNKKAKLVRLPECEVLLKHAQAISCVGSWYLDIPNNHLSWSDEAYRIFGVEHGTQITLKRFFELIHPDDREEVLQVWNSAVNHGTSYDSEHRILVHGKVRWLSERAELTRDQVSGRALTCIGTVQDITEKRDSQQEIQRLSEALRQSLVPMVINDAEGHVEFANQAFCKLVGYAEKDILEHHIRKFAPPQDHEHEMTVVRETIEKGIWRGEAKVCANDGLIIPVLLTLSRLHSSYGKSDSVIASFQDMRLIQAQQMALKNSEEQLRLALRSARMGVWEVDFTTKKIIWSPEIFRYFFRGEAEPTEEEFFESLVHPEDVEVLRETIKRSIAEKSNFIAEFRFGENGNYQWVEDRGQVILDAENNPIKMVGTVVEITDRKRADAEILSSKQRLEMALEASGLGLWDYDFSDDIFEMNDHWFAMLGYRHEDFRWDYGAWEVLIHPADLPRMKEILISHLQGNIPRFESEHRVRHKEGHWVWIQARGKVITRNREGSPLRMIGTHFDISHRKQLELEGTDLLKKIESLLGTINAASGGASGNEHVRQERNNDQLRLSQRQEEVLILIASGKTSQQIAQQLGISHGTVISHRKELMRKLSLHNVAELTRYALNRDLLNNGTYPPMQGRFTPFTRDS